MNVHDAVRKYYSKTLQGSGDLKTNACCTPSEIPAYVKAALAQIHNEVRSRYYGCGLVVPELLEGSRVLDLGCGSGRDCYLLSRLVGEAGFVVGVDITPDQLAVARRHMDDHRRRFGYTKTNLAFLEGRIEALDELELGPEGFDLVVSNCVLNLSPDKAAVLTQAHRLLRPGGELYFSDVYTDRRVPAALREDPVLYGECLSGALYWNDFEHLAKGCGFDDPRLVEDREIRLEDPGLRGKVGTIRFFSATYRLFRLKDLESACEDYGQAVIYKGSIPHHPHGLRLDKHHHMETGRVSPVCGNTYRMLSETRFAPHFEFLGDGRTHYGIFEGCGKGLPFDSIPDVGTEARGS
jgi:arsenite methyltransferase